MTPWMSVLMPARRGEDARLLVGLRLRGEARREEEQTQAAGCGGRDEGVHRLSWEGLVWGSAAIGWCLRRAIRHVVQALHPSASRRECNAFGAVALALRGI